MTDDLLKAIHDNMIKTPEFKVTHRDLGYVFLERKKLLPKHESALTKLRSFANRISGFSEIISTAKAILEAQESAAKVVALEERLEMMNSVLDHGKPTD